MQDHCSRSRMENDFQRIIRHGDNPKNYWWEGSLFISEQFGNCCNAYTKTFNKKYNRKGELFMDNLNRRTIDSETYYSKTVHYIHANAVQHGICKHIDAWPYSSYYFLITTQPTWLCEKNCWVGLAE